MKKENINKLKNKVYELSKEFETLERIEEDSSFSDEQVKNYAKNITKKMEEIENGCSKAKNDDVIELPNGKTVRKGGKNQQR